MNSMYCAEQINIPPELGAVLKQLTKAVLRDKPKELYKYSANFFAELKGQQLPFDTQGQLVSREARSTGSAGGPMVADVITDAQGFEALATTDSEAQSAINQIFKQYASRRNGHRIHTKDVPNLVEDLRRALGFDKDQVNTNDLLNVLDVDDDGTVDLNDFRQLFFNSE